MKCIFVRLCAVSFPLPSSYFVQISAQGVKCHLSPADLQFRTPLHWAAVMGLPELVRVLMDRGADPRCADAVGATPLHYAVRFLLKSVDSHHWLLFICRLKKNM